MKGGYKMIRSRHHNKNIKFYKYITADKEQEGKSKNKKDNENDLENSNQLPVVHSDNLNPLNSNQSQVAHSGNSDIDIHTHIEVDLTPIAFAILYLLVATKQLSNEEFKLALSKLEELQAR